MAYFSNYFWTGIKCGKTPRYDTEFAFEFIVICGATLFPEVQQQLRRYTTSTY